jgi:hypothetical protein
MNNRLFPNLIIIGAMKCGTSSLHEYLNLHPQINMSSPKELDFFIAEKNWEKGIDWYQSNFNCSSPIVGESSPNYTKFSVFQGVPKRMHRLIPKAKLIYLVRDPIKRIVSHFVHQYTARSELRKFSEVFSSLEDNHYVNCSCYAAQLEQFLEYYCRDQILVISLEHLSKKRINTLKQIFEFLEVDNSFEHSNFSKVFHQSKQKRRLTRLGHALFKAPAGGRLLPVMPNLMSEEIAIPQLSECMYSRFAEVLQKDIERFRSLTGQSFAEWGL